MGTLFRPNRNIPRQICKYWPEYHSGAFGNLWVFGPHYRAKELDFRRNAKEDALNFVLEKSGCTLPNLLSTLEKTEEARTTYADDTLNNLQRVEFQEMMAIDGCFFLLLAFSILGVVGSSDTEVGFPEKHLIFGIGCVTKEMDQWLESMFFIGNQIPLIVLEEIMKLKFFQELKRGKQWKKPLDSVRRALYNFLIVQNQPKPVDLIHCLQSVFLGVQSGSRVTVPIINLDAGDAVEEIPSAMELSKLGIKFKNLEGELGSRGIHYKRSALNDVLYLPVFEVDRYTELIIKCLHKYEMVQASRGIEPEATSYFKLLRELIRTPQDVEVLHSQGIIRGLPEGLAVLLSSFDGMQLSENLGHVRKEIRSHPLHHRWKRINLMLKLIAVVAPILAFLFAFLQTG